MTEGRSDPLWARAADAKPWAAWTHRAVALVLFVATVSCASRHPLELEVCSWSAPDSVAERLLPQPSSVGPFKPISSAEIDELLAACEEQGLECRPEGTLVIDHKGQGDLSLGEGVAWTQIHFEPSCLRDGEAVYIFAKMQHGDTPGYRDLKAMVVIEQNGALVAWSPHPTEAEHASVVVIRGRALIEE